MQIKRESSIDVRRLRISDLEETLDLISHIDSIDKLAPIARAQFLDEFSRRCHEEARFVATHEGRIVGTIGCGPGPIPSKQALWADWLVVAPDYRRCNVGSLLYGRIENLAIELKKRCLCLDIGNIDRQRAAYLFHRKNGFQVIGQIPDYWGALEHLNIMVKFLDHKDLC